MRLALGQREYDAAHCEHATVEPAARLGCLEVKVLGASEVDDVQVRCRWAALQHTIHEALALERERKDAVARGLAVRAKCALCHRALNNDAEAAARVDALALGADQIQRACHLDVTRLALRIVGSKHVNEVLALRLDERRTQYKLICSGLFEGGRASEELADHLRHHAIEACHVEPALGTKQCVSLAGTDLPICKEQRVVASKGFSKHRRPALRKSLALRAAGAEHGPKLMQCVMRQPDGQLSPDMLVAHYLAGLTALRRPDSYSDSQSHHRQLNASRPALVSATRAGHL